jgi:hypothetical protein
MTISLNGSRACVEVVVELLRIEIVGQSQNGVQCRTFPGCEQDKDAIPKAQKWTADKQIAVVAVLPSTI